MLNDADDAKIFAPLPLEPTEAMIDAGLAVMAAWHDLPGSAATVNREKMRRRYRAMVMAYLAGSK